MLCIFLLRAFEPWWQIVFFTAKLVKTLIGYWYTKNKKSPEEKPRGILLYYRTYFAETFAAVLLSLAIPSLSSAFAVANSEP
jgi:hypothetical protein